jgi:hypothetical protein
MFRFATFRATREVPMIRPPKATLAPLATCAALLFAAGSAAAAHASAVDAPAPQDARWLAWYGCWEVAGAEAGEASELLVCFDPMDRGVEITTRVDGEVVGVERMIADGSPSPIEEGGCVGERTADWSSDGARVFIRSEMRCGEEMTRGTRGVMAMSPDGEGWLEVHSVRAGAREPVLGVQRFVPAIPTTLQAHAVEEPGREHELAVRTARAAATARMDLDDVVEVVEEANADVARALVAEMGQPFRLDARALRDARDRGMPADVIDVVVAVTYPERFEIAGASWEATEAAPVRPAPRYERAVAPWGYGPRLSRLSWYYSPYYAWSPWGFDPYWHGVWGTPRVIVVQPSVRDRQARVNPLTGYTSDRATTRTAAPRGNQSGTASPPAATTRPRPTPAGVRQSGTSTSSGSSSATTTRRGSGDQGGSTGRQATRRGGGEG